MLCRKNLVPRVAVFLLLVVFLHAAGPVIPLGFSCPLIVLPDYAKLNAMRFFIHTFDARRSVTMWTVNDSGVSASPDTTVYAQVNVPATVGTLEINNAICSTCYDDDGETVNLADISPNCFKVVSCSNSFSIPHGADISLAYGKTSFIKTALDNCKTFIAGGILTSTAAFRLGPDIQTVSLTPAAWNASGANIIQMQGNESDVNEDADIPIPTTLETVKKGANTLTLATPVHCTFPNVQAYSMIAIPHATITQDQRNFMGNFSYSLCFAFNELANIHAACDADPACLGYSTYYYNATDGNNCGEYPFCLIYPLTRDLPNSINEAYVYNKVFNMKRSDKDRSCRAVAAKSGEFSVWVLLNYMRDNIGVEIRVNNRVVAQCPPLANHLRPLSSHCDTYALCYAGNHTVNSTIDAVVSENVAQGGCNVGAGVLIIQRTVDKVQVATKTILDVVAPDAIRKRGLDAAKFTPLRLSITNGAVSKRLQIYVYAVDKILLNVTQTSFEACPANSSTSCDDPPRVTMTVGQYQVACGGRGGFYNNTKNGLTDRCDLQLPCGDVIDLGGRTFTGFIYVDVVDLQLKTECGAFEAELLVAPAANFNASSSTFGYALGSSRAGFRVVFTKFGLAANPGFTAASPQAIDSYARENLFPAVIQNASQNPDKFLFAFLYYNLPWFALRKPEKPNGLKVPQVLGCVMDQVEVGGMCLIIIPQGSNFLTISVLQTILIPSQFIQIFIWNDDVLLESMQCRQLDSSLVGTEDMCKMSTCYSQFLVDPTLSSDITVVIAPGVSLSTQCDATMAVTIAFENRSDPVLEDCTGKVAGGEGFLCEADRKCISVDHVCDLEEDCPSGADEEICSNWYLVETGLCLIVNETTAAAETSVEPTLQACRLHAIIVYDQTTAAPGSTPPSFSYNPSTRQCNVTVDGGFAATVLPCAASTKMFHYLPNGQLTYTGCSNVVQCSGNGIANFTNGQCECACFKSYSGDNCASFQSPKSRTGALVIHFTLKNLQEASLLDVTAVEHALKKFTDSDEDETVTCGALEEQTPKSAALLCTTSLESDAVALRGFNGQLFRPYYIEQLTSTAYSQLTDCDSHVPPTHNNLLQVQCGPKSGTVKWVRLKVASNQIATGITIQTMPASSRRSASDVHACKLVTTQHRDGCYTTTCIVHPNAPFSNINFAFLNATVKYAQPLDTDDDCFENLEMHGFTFVDLPVLSGQTPMVVSSTAFIGFAIGGSVVLVISVLLVLLAARFHFGNLQALKDIFSQVDNAVSSVVKSLLKIFLGPQPNVTDRGDNGRRTTMYGIISYNIAIIGGILLLLYATKAYNVESSYSVLIEVYSSDDCGKNPSSTSYIPSIAMKRKSLSSSVCAVPTTAGEIPAPIYIHAECIKATGASALNGSVFVKAKVGISTHSCEFSSFVVHANGTCVRMFDSYFRFMCDTVENVDKRFNFLQTLFAPSDVARNVSALSRLFPVEVPDVYKRKKVGGVYTYQFREGTHPSTSNSPNTLASVASEEFFFPSHRLNAYSGFLVFQDSSTLVSADAPWTALNSPPSVIVAAEKQVPGAPKIFAQELAPYIPRLSVPDIPIAFVMNNFNQTAPDFRLLSPLVTPPERMTFLDIKDQIFNVGNSFGPGTNVDGVGFTINCYLRVLDSSVGFIYAATDALIRTNADGTGNASPLLDLLQSIIVQGLDGSSWHDSLNVYYSLYLNGPGRTLTFAMATPQSQLSPDQAHDETNPVEQVSWDLDQLSIPLTNGRWHQVGIVLRNDNNQVKVQLIVDGKTSVGQRGWNLCLGRRPKPIRDITRDTIVRSEFPLSDILFNGGMMTVGAISGSVSRVELDDSIVNIGIVLKQGTEFMRSTVDLENDKIRRLAVALFVLVGILVLLTIVSSGLAIMDGEEQHEAEFVDDVVGSYASAVAPPVLDKEGNRYPRIGFAQASRWLGCSMFQMELVMVEIRENTATPNIEVIRVLSLVRKSQLDNEPRFRHASLPSHADWLKLLRRDADAFAEELLLPPKWYAPFVLWQTSAVPDKLYKLEEKIFSEADARYVSGGTGAYIGPGRSRNTSVHINMKGIGGKHASKSSGGSGGSSMSKQIYNMFLPIITSFQTVFVWMSSLRMPGNYNDSFGKFFAALSVDMTSLIRDLSIYATPLVQLFLGLSIAAWLSYLCVADNEAFNLYLARYTYRRDLDEQKKVDAMEQLPKVDLDEPVKQPEKQPEAKIGTENVKEVNNEVENLDQELVTKGPDSNTAFTAVEKIDVTYVDTSPPDSKSTKERHFVQFPSSPSLFEPQSVSFIGIQPVENESLRSSDGMEKSTMSGSRVVECEVLSRMTDLYGHSTVCNYQYQLSTLTISTAHAIDSFMGVKIDSDDELDEDESIRVTDCEQNKFSIGKVPPSNGQVRDVAQRQTFHPCSDAWITNVKVNPESTETKVAPYLEIVGCHCRHHPNRLLSGQLQSRIWPFDKPPTCCVMVNGKACGTFIGQIFLCGAIHTNKDGELALCEYALCERHCRFSVSELLLSEFVGWTRVVRERGVRWVTAAILIILANALYMPCLKTALMILACHPFYQCTLKCYSDADQTFVIAAFLAIVLVVVLGLGLPLLQGILLYKRKQLFDVIFFAEDYNGLYTDAEDETQVLNEGITFKKLLNSFITGQGFRFIWRRGRILFLYFWDHLDAAHKKVKSKMNMTTEAEEESLKYAPVVREEEKDDPTVNLQEWERFLSCDPTALAVLYNMLELEYMYMTPILLIFKVLLVAPVVFLETGTYNQRVGMAVVETLFATLIFVTAPFVSPIVDAMYRLASIHQLLLLGLQNLDSINASNGDADLGVVMLLTSVVYAAICIACIVYVSVYPAVRQIHAVETSDRMLTSFGLHYSQTTTLYVSPVGGDRFVADIGYVAPKEGEERFGEEPDVVEDDMMDTNETDILETTELAGPHKLEPTAPRIGSAGPSTQPTLNPLTAAGGREEKETLAVY